MPWLKLTIHLVGLLITLTREIRSLRNQGPFLYAHPATTTGRHQTMTMMTLVKQADLGPEPEGMDTSKALEFQMEIEKLFHKNQLFPRIKGEFTNCSEFDFEAHMKAHDINVEFGFDLLVQLVLNKRAPLQTLVGSLRKHFDGDCQKTADELVKACGADLVDWNPVVRQFIIRFGISADIQEDLDRYQYPLPMVVEPRTLTSNRSSGYYTGKDSVILRNNHHELDVCLDHLNAVNKTKFRINQQVAQTIKNRWRNLDKPKPDEEQGEYQKRVKAFEKYDRTAHDVMHHLGLAGEGEFYLTHKYDKRGRTYCQGYVVNYQGTAWNKAVIEFANQEIVE